MPSRLPSPCVVRRWILTVISGALAATLASATAAQPAASGDQVVSLQIGGTGRQPITRNYGGGINSDIQAWLDSVPDGDTVTLDATGLQRAVKAVYAREPDNAPLRPGASWTGALNSGWANWKDCDGAAQSGFPVNPDTTSRRPVGQFRLIPWQRVGDGFVVTVKADGAAPVAYVDIIAEGGCTRVSTRSIYSYRGTDGVWHDADGYHARVDLPAFLKVSQTGQVNLAARVVSTDGAITYRVVGREASPASGNGYLSGLTARAVILPRSKPYSVRINVDPDTTADCVDLGRQAAWPAPRAACKTPDLAMQIAAGETVSGVSLAAGADFAPEIVVTKTMTWNPKSWGLRDATGADAGVTNLLSAGWPTIRAEGGAVLTIRRAAFDDSSRAALFWQPRLAPLRLQGANVVHDQTNGGFLYSVASNEAPFWYDGITVPAGDKDPMVYLRPDKMAYPNSVTRYVTNGRYERGLIVLKSTSNLGTYSQGLPMLAWDFISNGTTGDLTNSAVVFDNIIINNFGNYPTFRDQINSIRIWYDGPDPTATIWKEGNEGADNGRIHLNQSSLADNSQVIASGAKRTLQEVVDEVNRVYGAAGWHAELCTRSSSCAGDTPLVADDRETDRHPVYLMNVGGKDGKPIDAKGRGLVLKTRVDIHADFHQFRGGDRSQRIINNVQGLDWKAIQTGKMDGRNVVQEMSFANIAITPVGGETFASVRASYDVGVQHHQILLKNWFDGGSSWTITSHAEPGDPYNVFTSSILNRLGWKGAPQRSPVLDHVIVRNAGPGLSTGKGAGVTLDGGWRMADLYPHYADHDWSPAGLLVAKENLKPPEPNVPFDIDGQLFRERDAIGPGAMRVTQETIAKANAMSIALRTYEAAKSGPAGTLVLTTQPRAGGPRRELRINVSIAP